MYRRRHTFSIATLLLLVGCLPVAMAQRSQEERLPDTRYQHGRQRKLKACVLLLPTPGEPQTSGGPSNPFVGGIADPDAAIPARSPNPYPYLFYVMNERTDMRPDGWRFYNPAAPTFPSAGQVLRWGSAGLTAARQLTPDMAPYWEVVLSATNMEKLSQMDVIYLPIARRNNNNPVATYFTEEQRQMLSRIVDGGATIWVDWALDAPTQDGMLGGSESTTVGPGGSVATQRNKNGFFANLDFGSYSSTAGSFAVGHPLLTSLFVMQPGEGADVGSLYGSATVPSQSRVVELRASDQQPVVNMTAVVPLANAHPTIGAYIAAARYGSGYIVATAGNVGKAIAGMIPTSTLRVSSVSPRPDLALAQQEDLKFAYNVFAWRNEVISEQKNPRHTAQSSIQVNGMVEQWTFPNLVPGGLGGSWTNYPLSSVNPADPAQFPSNPAAPLIVDGIVVAPVRYNNGGTIVNQLHAFEANPADDFNGDGYSDDPNPTSAPASDPYADLKIGQNYDRMMHLDLGTEAVMGMTLGEVPDAAAGSTGSRAFVFGATSGSLFAVPAPRPGLPIADYWTTTNRVVVNDSSLPVIYTGAPSFVNIPAPIPTSGPPVVASQLIAGGIARTAGTNSPTAGKVTAYNLTTNGVTTTTTPAWYYPPNLESNRLGPPAGPTVTAQVMDAGTGAIDTMVFVTTAADPNQRQAGQVAGDTNGRVEGFILATKGELLGFPTPNNNPSAQTPDFGRRFTSIRWLNIPQNSGPVPPGPELAWDPSKHYEVRVLSKTSGYVVARFTRTDNNIQLLTDGTGGQVLLPNPGGLTPPAGFPPFNVPGQPAVWNLQDYVLVADYSWLPIPVDNNTGRTLRPRFSPPTPYFRQATGTNSAVQLTGVAGGVAVGRDNLVYYGTGNGYMCAVEWRRGRAQFRWKFRSEEYTDQRGKISSPSDLDPTTPGHLSDFVFTAAPAAGDRIVFASKNVGGATGRVYIIDPDATLTFKLQMPTDAMGNPLYKLTAASAQDIVLEGDHGTGIQQVAGGNSGIKSSLPPFGQAQGQFTVNPDTETVTFHNMMNISLDLREARSPEQLLNAVALGQDTDGDGVAGPNIDTGGKPAAPIRWWIQQTGNYLPNALVPLVNGQLGGRRIAWVPLPLVATYKTTVPGVPSSGDTWRSGPVIAGERAYLMGSNGHLHEIPLDPKTIDPRFPLRRNGAGQVITGLAAYNLGDYQFYGPDGLRRVRAISYVPGVQQYSNPAPAISQGIVALASPRGLTAYASPNVVVADTNRVVEASGDSTALASLDLTVKHRIDRNEFAIPTDPSFANTGGFPIITERKLLNRPSVVRKLNRASSLASIFASSSLNRGPVDYNTATGGANSGIRESPEWAEESYIAADTGNNRCVEFNAAGKVIWEMDQFQDPFNLLPAGEATKLSQPMDVQRWVELEPYGTGFVHVIHTLIADTGNTRVIEVVDKVLYQQGVFNGNSYVTIPGQKASGTNPPDMNAPDVRWYHVLVWSSQTNAQGLRLKYRTAQRVYWPDGSGDLIPNPAAAGRVASSTYPYLPEEPYLSYTMASVSGQQVLYPKAPSSGRGYNQFYTINASDRALIERKPVVRPGGDSIVFLRGRLKLDEGNRNAPVRVTTFREDRPGVVATGDANIYAQGIIDPNVAVINDIYQEFSAPSAGPVVHRLNGVSSIQRTIRADVRFAPDLLAGGTAVQDAQAMFFLIADTDGVWEIRMVPHSRTWTDITINASTAPAHRLAWAFTIEDYAYVTGAGNGDPNAYASPNAGSHTPGGRLLSPASARRLPNGLVLIASRTPLNPLPPRNSGFNLLHAGADIFLLRATDFRTYPERAAQGTSPQYLPYQRGVLVDGNRPLHGWAPDLWVQTQFGPAVSTANLLGATSIRWRAAEQIDPKLPPSLRTASQGGANPLELSGTYLPVQPNYADLVF